MKILMVLTSHGILGNTGKPTGLWLEEFANPFFYFQDHGCRVDLASPQGGCPPLDPKSSESEYQTDSTRRFDGDNETQRLFKQTIPLSKIDPSLYDGVFYPGGHGPLWDLVESKDSIRIIEKMLSMDKPVGSVCHGPAVLAQVKNPKGEAVVSGRRVTSFSNAEEFAIGLEKIVPFLIEDKFKAQGAFYTCSEPWKAHVVVDGLIVTGQNPASSEGVAEAVLKLAQKTKELKR